MKLEAGHVAVVTGGTSGIGFALADLLIRRGVDVMIADIREAAVPAALDALAGHAGRAAGVRVDVSIGAQLDALAEETVERFGRVDLVCNNAGVVCELTPAGAAATPTDRDEEAMRGAISAFEVAEAAIDAVEVGRVHAVVGHGAASAARQRIDALLADLP